MSEVFISYAWGGESDAIANALEETFRDKGIKLVRDKTDLGYKGLVKQFMQQIGQGKCVVALVSDKYLKSKNCMFELLEISRNGEFYDRIFPIVLKDARIYDVIERLNYIKYWEGKIKELEEGMREVSLANLQGFREEIDLYTEIRNKVAGLVDTLQNMNTLTVQMHQKSGFEVIVEAIAKRLDKDAESCPYRGLFTFLEEDEGLFFGREKFTEELVKAVRQQSLVAIIGASGSGKSSVVFAGLIPRLRASKSVKIVSFRPGNNPFESLAIALQSEQIVESPDFSPNQEESNNLVTDSNRGNNRRFVELKLETELKRGEGALSVIIENFVQQHPGIRGSDKDVVVA